MYSLAGSILVSSSLVNEANAGADNMCINKKDDCFRNRLLAGAERFELSTRGFGDRCSTS